MDEYEKFRYKLFQLFQGMIRNKLEEVVGMEMNFAKELLGIDINHAGIGILSQRDNFLIKLFRGYVEINSSYLTLKDIEVYMERFPYRRKNLSKTRYIEYHIGNYLNEIYILKCRLIAYLDKLKKLFKEDDRDSLVNQLADGISKIIDNGFKNIKEVRGNHVHQSRYTNDDFLKLGAIEELIASNDENIEKKLNPIYRQFSKKIENEWVIGIKENNKGIRIIINSYFGALSKVLFDNNENLIYPQTLNKPY